MEKLEIVIVIINVHEKLASATHETENNVMSIWGRMCCTNLESNCMWAV